MHNPCHELWGGRVWPEGELRFRKGAVTVLDFEIELL